MYDEIKIAKDMSNIKGYRLKSIVLFNLIRRYIVENDQTKKEDYKKRIRYYIYHIFINSIDKNSKNELYFLSSNISYDCGEVERHARSWDINNYGITKTKYENGKAIIVDFIPRNDNKGFYLEEDASQEAKNFIKKHRSMLSIIDENMSKKEDLITNKYQPKENIPKSFTEELIDYIGFRRIGDTKKVNISKKNNNNSK